MLYVPDQVATLVSVVGVLPDSTKRVHEPEFSTKSQVRGGSLQIRTELASELTWFESFLTTISELSLATDSEA